MNKPYVGRFAPSPTGPLHFGSLVAAVASYLDARAHHGRWLVRIEDVDTTRCRPEFTAQILSTLSAFGMEADGEVIVQSGRSAIYEDALEQLRSAGQLYACTCSRKEIADSALRSGIEGPVYPGTCRHAGHPESGHGAHGAALRVRTHDRLINFQDRLQGEVSQRIESQIGDFVVKRRDGCYAYQLAVVVDDAAQQVSHVVRGADLLDSTARQIHLQRLLGLPEVQYLHIPVVANADGEKLSKQTLAEGIDGENPSRWLLRALRFLGQPLPPGTEVEAQMLPPAQLLHRAAQQWQPDAIPRQRALPVHFIGADNGR